MISQKETTSPSKRQSRKTALKQAECMKKIVGTLGLLKEEAQSTNLDDAEMVLDAAHKICLSFYYLQLRERGTENLKQDKAVLKNTKISNRA